MSNRTHERNTNMWRMVLPLAVFGSVVWVLFFSPAYPEVWHIPSFFWYQFLWVIISALVTAAVYLKATSQFQLVRRKQPKQRHK